MPSLITRTDPERTDRKDATKASSTRQDSSSPDFHHVQTDDVIVDLLKHVLTLDIVVFRLHDVKSGLTTIEHQNGWQQGFRRNVFGSYPAPSCGTFLL